ncbi:sulfotransferase [Ruegeria sp. 2012CJ41-6]|uniref:Sulfotransferase n=1 Tax=Ruegeria spongiae TaxID=2942209 RepID=A0ABT0Q2H2_9RHOB|nr:sulfotransferase [Ruegeria spongiae]MCL6284078.1 sulfotransferase [Ruegeria spongiae]
MNKTIVSELKKVSALIGTHPERALKKANLGFKKHPDQADFSNLAGLALVSLKRPKEAAVHFQKAAKLRPDHLPFRQNLLNALVDCGGADKALAGLQQLFDSGVDSPALRLSQARAQIETACWDQAVESATRALAMQPGLAEAHLARGIAKEFLKQLESSAQDFETAFSLAPADDRIATNHARALAQAGDTEPAILIHRQVLQRTPNRASNLFELARIHPSDSVSQLADEIEAALEQSSNAEDRELLCFAMTDLLNRAGDMDGALHWAAQANTQQFRHMARLAAQADPGYSKIFDREFSGGVNAPSPVAPCPIFVLGQPRSGTTLVEMMLTRLENVFSCGELRHMDNLARPYLDPDIPFGPQEADQLAQSYLDALPANARESRAFVDKMPHNYQLIGFILTAFPHARIVHCLRDPRDVALSMWLTRFPAAGLTYTSDLDAMAEAANTYRRHMARWEALYPEQILTVRYEDLVAMPEPQSRRMVDHCGLDWNEAILRPEQNTARVHTASAHQVRKPISGKAVGRWHQAEDVLRPFINKLDPELWPEFDLLEQA